MRLVAQESGLARRTRGHQRRAGAVAQPHRAIPQSLLDGAGELGKKLDFLLQEMRIAKPIRFLSKTPGLGEEGLAISEFGLQIKSDIEKLREQVQNVE